MKRYNVYEELVEAQSYLENNGFIKMNPYDFAKGNKFVSITKVVGGFIIKNIRF